MAKFVPVRRIEIVSASTRPKPFEVVQVTVPRDEKLLAATRLLPPTNGPPMAHGKATKAAPGRCCWPHVLDAKRL